MENQENKDMKITNKISKSRIEELEAKERELEAIKRAKSQQGEELIIEPIEYPDEPVKTQQREVFNCLNCNVEVYPEMSECPSCGHLLEWGE